MPFTCKPEPPPMIPGAMPDAELVAVLRESRELAERLDVELLAARLRCGRMEREAKRRGLLVEPAARRTPVMGGVKRRAVRAVQEPPPPPPPDVPHVDLSESDGRAHV